MLNKVEVIIKFVDLKGVNSKRIQFFLKRINKFKIYRENYFT